MDINPPKILIIDDEATIRQSFADYLEDLGYLTLTAENGQIGIDRMQQEQPDLILTDLRMPVMDGMEVVRRGCELAPNSPIIVVSGAGRISDAIHALRSGAWDYVLKPLEDISVLGYRVEKALEKARLLLENKMYQENLERMVSERTAELEQANKYLAASEERYRTLFERSSDAIFLIDASNGQYINANQAAEALTGYSIAEIKSKSINHLTPKGATGTLNLIKNLETTETIGEVTYARPDGSERIAILSIFPLQNKELVVGIAHDITERVRADEELKKLGTAMRQSPAIVMITDPKGNIEYVNPKFSQVTGYSTEEALGKNPRILQGGETSKAEYEQLWKTISAGEEWHGIFHNKKKDGELYWEETSISAIHDDKGQITHFIALKEDITDRKRAEEALRDYIKRLDSLHQIDQAITSGLDLKATLNVFLDHLLAQLGMDAAAVLYYKKDIQALTFFQGRGFDSAKIQATDLRLGQGYAGEAALQRKSVYIPDLTQSKRNAFLSPWFHGEGFRAYYGIPLIAKGALVGVLEVFHRSTFTPNDEWLEYLQVLAGQAAIAIDNADLFKDLQRSNLELALAYDATIEGWAKALEIRDMETEGHSRRVVAQTIKLAQHMGIKGQELKNLRRGALLHDIGKMGVPDSILQKPGPLTEAEWEIMLQHPVFAYQWLSPIEYLSPALEIPYYHHEKWDGSGYPCGLIGAEIPLAARIFAIVDVWDALSSDRPYRSAWPQEKALAYIQDQTGIHFDPTIVKYFLKTLA